ncbi:MAG: FtsQ-type POTRA domain-containing protein [Hyphomicrobium sp.]|nr:FtsQ-type POTRA domain-containing protein [Hyphomicrobium sp.]
MQQVGTGSRFWWRALDAPTSDPATSYVQPRVAKPWSWNFSTAPKLRAEAGKQPYKLQIPRGERRHRGRRRSARGWASMMFACLGVALLTAAGVIVASTAKVSSADLMLAANERLTTSLVALGFGLDRISVNGHHVTNDRDIFDALDLPNVATLWQLDTVAALKRIERISWVDTAQITRVFPSGLDVAITERSPAAIWTRDGTDQLIDVSGRVLGPADRRIASQSQRHLPVLAGEGANTDVSLIMTALGRHPQLQARVLRSERIAERRWRIILKTGTAIELAAEREIEGLDQVASDMTLRKALDGGPVVIDVRTPGRITIRPRLAQSASNAAMIVSR